MINAGTPDAAYRSVSNQNHPVVPEPAVLGPCLPLTLLVLTTCDKLVIEGEERHIRPVCSRLSRSKEQALDVT
jgi:hypothetical protein